MTGGRVWVVELDVGAVRVVVDGVGAFELDCGQAVTLGRALLDGAPAEGTHGPRELTPPQQDRAGVGAAQRGPTRLSEPLSDLLASLHQQHPAGSGTT